MSQVVAGSLSSMMERYKVTPEKASEFIWALYGPGTADVSGKGDLGKQLATVRAKFDFNDDYTSYTLSM
jgi:hypothetical protein